MPARSLQILKRATIPTRGRSQSRGNAHARRRIPRRNFSTDVIPPSAGRPFRHPAWTSSGMSRCATALAAPDISGVKAAICGACLHEMIELRPLARNQELGRGIVEALTLKLSDRGAQFQDLGAQFQGPVGVRVFLHHLPPSTTSFECLSGERACSRPSEGEGAPCRGCQATPRRRQPPSIHRSEN